MIQDSDIKQHNIRSRLKLLRFGFKWKHETEDDKCIKNVFVSNTKEYESIYIKEKSRGHKLFKFYVTKPIVTLPECGLEKFLDHNKIDYISLYDGLESAYAQVEWYYKDKKANRSGIPYMNHIDEGLGILYLLEAKPEAMEAFLLHQFYQDTLEIQTITFIQKETQKLLSDFIKVTSDLTRKKYKTNGNIYNVTEKLIDDNTQLKSMLIADKIQNYKDFSRNKNVYDERIDIEKYFLWWFDTLQISHRFLANTIEYVTLN